MKREDLRKILRGKCVTDEACEAAIDELLKATLSEQVDRSTKATKEAVECIWFDDNSDYESSLYKVVSILTGKDIDSINIDELYEQFKKERE